METHPREGVVKEEPGKVSKHPLTSRSVGSFGISESNITGSGGKKNNKTLIMCLTTNPMRSSPEARIHHQQVGVEQGGTGCIA